MAEAGREAGPCDGGFLTLPGGEACDHSSAATALPANIEPACRPPLAGVRRRSRQTSVRARRCPRSRVRGVTR
jgi:hypothetical protein